MPSPFFSIIIPTFNSEKTLQDALTSILEQSLTDFEVLIIDGLSTDNTLKIIKENSERDKRISFISEKDSGIYDAMNKGIGIAKGQWIYFIGSDDKLYSKTVLEAVSNDLQICACDFYYGNVIMPFQKKPYDGVFDFNKLLARNISHQAIFFNRQLFEKLGVYNTQYRMCADWDFNIRYFQQADLKPAYNNITIAYFGEGGASSQYDILFLRKRIIPLRRESLIKAPNSLRNIMVYDQWWRLLRNSKIRSLNELYDLIGSENIPREIKSMVFWQQKTSLSLLNAGVFSKLYMFLNYLFNLIRITS
jgi:glycosyltransferase involved in cell wall biosynthesis